MSYANEAPAAAWYPDPQTAGQVRWWDGTNWTEHVSTASVATPSVAEQLAAPIASQLAEMDAIFAAAAERISAEHTATVTYIGRHAAGETPAPRQPSSAPRFRPRIRAQVPAQSLSYA